MSAKLHSPCYIISRVSWPAPYLREVAQGPLGCAAAVGYANSGWAMSSSIDESKSKGFQAQQSTERVLTKEKAALNKTESV